MVDTILTPDAFNETPTIKEEQNSFLIDNYLSELETDSQKGIARENLGVYGKTDLYTQVEVDNVVNKTVGDAIKSLLTADDPHQILPKVTNLLKDYLKVDGTTPFTAPQSGKDPLKDSDLTTKRYVNSLLDNHTKSTDPHNTMDLVKEELKQYVLKNNVYGKNDVYTKEQISKIIKPFVKTDGTTPFLAPQSGVTPITDQHLATKRYVDNVMFKHDVNADPHGFLTILNQRLANYYKSSETYSKAETYSRAQIDQVINTLVTDAAYQAIREHTRQFDPHNILKEIYKEHYVKRDGSIPFTAPQKGVEGYESENLATVGQLARVKEELSKEIVHPVWVTSGPIQTTVGFMEDNDSTPTTMTFQEAMDAIFYGNIVNVTAPETVSVGTTTQVTMTIRGNALIEKAELYQNEKLIGTYDREAFLEWSHTVESDILLNNTTFTFVVYYINGQKSEASCISKISYGIFVGSVPRECLPGDLRYSDMIELRDHKLGEIYGYNEDVREIKHKFNFSGNFRKLTLAIPSSYNQLDYMHTASQHFGEDAFLVEEIPVSIPGVQEVILYTFYMYNQPLIAFNSEVIFKLSKHE